MKDERMTPEIRNRIRSWIRSSALGMIGYAIAMFLTAGTWTWFWGWVFMGLLTLAMASHVWVLVPINPALLADRAGGIRQPGAKPWDVRLAFSAGLLFMAILIVAALDHRRGWSGEIPAAWHLAGVVLFVIWWTVFLWAMASNPFFSESVRIQEHHRVAERGPYRFVRHPGYAGNLIGCLGLPLVLGSWWAYIPAALALMAFVLRTALEDRTLQEELEGYTEYAQRTRYRLIPRVW